MTAPTQFPEVWRFFTAERYESAAPRSINHRLAAIAGRQHGVVTVRQLIALGFTANAISRRAENGLFHQVHSGVYAIGHPNLSTEGRFLAAVLAGGVGAALCHESAAHILRIRELRDVDQRPVDIYVPRRHDPVAGVRLHRSRTMSPASICPVGVVPTVVPVRTVFDLGDVIDELELGKTLREATFRYRIDFGCLDGLVVQHRGRRAARVTRAALERWRTGGTGTDSKVEHELHTRLRRGGWEQFEANFALAIGGAEIRVDAYLPRIKLVLEADPRNHEREPIQREDALRDGLIRADGKQVLRLTRREIAHFDRCVAPRLRALGVRQSRGVAVFYR